MSRCARAATLAAFAVAILAPIAPAQAQTTAAPPDDLKTFVPSTLSPASQAALKRFLAYRRSKPTVVARSEADLVAAHAATETFATAFFAPALKAIGGENQLARLGGVDVVAVRPQGYKDDGTRLIYVHGGGFVTLSAKSSLIAPAMMAKASGRQVISVDYTTAPKGRWPQVTDQVIAVYKALLSQGRRPSSIGLFGESAGGDIIAGSVLKLRDQGLPLPGGLFLVSPVTDLTHAGDTKTTLAAADPSLRWDELQPGYEAYAAPGEYTDPYVSPVYGDFRKGFPPTLIVGGTKELLLSDFVRLNRAIKTAGGRSELDLFEGEIHAFPSLFPNTPEAQTVYLEASALWSRTLAR